MVTRGWIAAFLLLAGCAGSPDPVTPTDRRINEAIDRTAAAGFPDVRDVPGQGPEIPSAAEIAAAEAALIEEGRALLETVDAIREEEQAAAQGRNEKAAALRDRIDADRAAAAAEGSLSDRELP